MWVRAELDSVTRCGHAVVLLAHADHDPWHYSVFAYTKNWEPPVAEAGPILGRQTSGLLQCAARMAAPVSVGP